MTNSKHMTKTNKANKANTKTTGHLTIKEYVKLAYQNNAVALESKGSAIGYIFTALYLASKDKKYKDLNLNGVSLIADKEEKASLYAKVSETIFEGYAPKESGRKTPQKLANNFPACFKALTYIELMEKKLKTRLVAFGNNGLVKVDARLINPDEIDFWLAITTRKGGNYCTVNNLAAAATTLGGFNFPKQEGKGKTTKANGTRTTATGKLKGVEILSLAVDWLNKNADHKASETQLETVNLLKACLVEYETSQAKLVATPAKLKRVA